MKKYFALCLSFILIFYSVSAGLTPLSGRAADDYLVQIMDEKYSPGDKVTFIVEVEGDPVLAGTDAAEIGADFISTAGGQLKEESVLQTQGEVLDSISSSTDNAANPRAVYTLLFNGFSIEASYGDMEKIKNLPNVKNVYISEKYQLKPHLNDSTGIIGADDPVISGYTGKGQLIAVIDNEFRTSHNFFKAEPIDPKYTTADDVASVASDAGLAASIDPAQAFKSIKIPFAYDYCGNNGNGDYNTYCKGSSHGTHVAGIAAGKNGVYSDGTTINGVAPDAQLILMKVADDSGNFYTDIAFQAVEDAVKLGADVINCSFGGDYLSPYLAPALEKFYINAKSAGVILSTSAGNMGRGFNRNYTKILTDNIDYSTSGFPATFDSSFAVASVSKAAHHAPALTSSYGVTENLKLKPNISAPGVDIYSSVRNADGAYGVKSGTSMAAPHIAGLVAVMHEYLDKKNLDITKDEKAILIENLLMSTAAPVTYTNNLPYSPRVQGAGIANIANAVKTPAILVGSDGICQINLGDELGAEFDISFKVQNLTANTVTYDGAKITCLTDGYMTDSSTGKSYVNGTSQIGITSCGLPQETVVGPYETKAITFRLSLNTDQIKTLSQIFKNGFFLDGFISLTKSNKSIPTVGIPFMGFCGDWTEAPLFDNNLYQEGGSTIAPKNLTYETYLFEATTKKVLGYNGNNGYDSKYIAISPNNNPQVSELGFNLTPLRTMSELYAIVVDKSNEIPAKGYVVYNANKFYPFNSDIFELTGYSDGEYAMVFYGEYNYQKENPTTHTMEIPFYIDTVAPEIRKASVTDGKVNVVARDNKHISRLDINYADSAGAPQTITKYAPNPEENTDTAISFDTRELDVREISLKDISVTIYDMAGNTYENTLSCVMGDIHPKVTHFSYTNNVYALNLDITNYKQSQVCTMILAIYNDDGALIHAEMRNEQLDTPESTVIFASKVDLSKASKYKLFILNNTNQITPLDISKELNVN